MTETWVDDFRKIRAILWLGSTSRSWRNGFCTWHGRRMTPGNDGAGTCMGAMTGLFDDFFDKEFPGYASIRLLMDQMPWKGKASNENCSVFFSKPRWTRRQIKPGSINTGYSLPGTGCQ